MKQRSLQFLSCIFLLGTHLFAGENQPSEWNNCFKQHKNKVVQIFVHTKNYNIQYFKPHTKEGECSESFGSGFFINPKGDILTCYHVVDNCEDKIFIQVPQLGKEQFEVTFQGGFPALDCALLKLKDEELTRMLTLLNLQELPFLELGNSDTLEAGQEVMAIGYPFAQQNVKSATGIISGPISEESGEWKATTVPTNPGNSGGPMVDKSGNVVGICNAIHQSESETLQSYIVPITNVKQYLPFLKDQTIIRTPFWGISTNELSKMTVAYLKAPALGGAFVAKIYAQSLGEKAGLQKSDIITKINGMAVDRFCRVTVPWTDYQMSINDVLMRYAPGDAVVFTVARDGRTVDLSVIVTIEHPLKIGYHFNPFEKIPTYEIIGGIVFMETTMNHIITLIPYLKYKISTGTLSPSAHYLDIEKRYQSKVAMPHFFPGAEIEQMELSKSDGNFFINTINGHVVNTLQEFKDAILDHANEDFIAIQTVAGTIIALRIKDILNDEPKFAEQKGYTPTSIYHELLQKRKSLGL
jgi:S1-C subfamily serine protease